MYVRNQMLENARRRARLNRIEPRSSVRDTVTALVVILALCVLGSAGAISIVYAIAEALN